VSCRSLYSGQIINPIFSTGMGPLAEVRLTCTHVAGVVVTVIYIEVAQLTCKFNDPQELRLRTNAPSNPFQ
jgi:hypothetical protein